MAAMTYAQIIARGEVEGITPYQLASLINMELAGRGMDPIRPQMMYNYNRNGMIVKGVKNLDRFTVAQALEYVGKFVANRVLKAQGSTPASTVQDLNAQIEELIALRDKLAAQVAEDSADQDVDNPVDEDVEA